MIITKYKFTTSIDTVPKFNTGYAYNIEDIDNGDGTTTRTITSETLPTSISFASCMGLLEVYSLDISNLTSLSNMFRGCENLTTIQGTENWKTTNIRTMTSTFHSCKKLKSLNCTNWDVSNVISMATIFYYCDAITGLGDLSNWNVGKVTDFTSAFRLTGKLLSIGNISNWNVKSSNSFRYMFYQSGLTSIDMSNWVFDEEKTSTINFSCMFGDTKNLVRIMGLERFPMHRANTLQQTFYNCKALTELNIGNWDVSNITNMQQAFGGCTSLTTLDLSNWNTKALTNMNYAFSSCVSLQEINLSGWDTGSITNAESVFSEGVMNSVTLKDCSVNTVNFFINILPSKPESSLGYINTNLEKKDLSNIDTTTLASKFWNLNFLIAKYVFNSEIDTLPTFNFSNYYYIDKINEDNTISREIYHTTSPTKINFNGKTGLLEVQFLDMSNISDVLQMFYDCTSLTKVNTDNWKLNKVSNTSNMFRGCSSLVELDLSSLDFSNVTNMQGMFIRNTSLVSVGDTSSWKLSKVTNMGNMFEGCSSLRELNTSNWKLNKVSNTFNMFRGCSSLVELDLSNSDFSNVTNMQGMFAKNTSLVSVGDTSFWKLGKVTNMNFMFEGCSSLRELNTSNWGMSSVKTMTQTFDGCSLLTKLDVSNWDVSNVTTMLKMFSGCSSLTDMNLSRWDISSLTNTENMFNKCLSLKSLDMSNLDMSKVTNSNNMFNSTNLRKIKLLDNPLSTIERIIALLPAKKTENTGYLFVREEYSNSKKWENIICKETTQHILLPKQLNNMGEISDRLYWDNNKKCYCIEQNIGDDYTILSEPIIIDLPNLSQKYYLDTYVPETGLMCSNSTVKPSKILIETDKFNYKPVELEPNKKYTIQFKCEKVSEDEIKFNLGGTEVSIQAVTGLNSLNITTPLELSSDMLNISGYSDKTSNIMLFIGDVKQSPNYFDAIQSTGELQEDGTYKIDIETYDNKENNFIVSIKLNEPLRKGDILYWNISNKRYEVNRSGTIEVPVVEGDVIDLPRLYQKNGTNIRVETGNINSSVIEIEYIDIN